MCIQILNDLDIRDIATMRDGYEALGRLLKEPFDAVITSLHVPNIDGQSLLPVLRLIPGPNRTTPVILLAANAADVDRSAAAPEYLVVKTPEMPQRLKRILRELKGDAGFEGAALPEDRSLRKIVLIDDAAAIHQLLRLSFRPFPDIEIVGVDDPTAALEFVRAHRPSLILLDVNMPKLSGREVIRSLKSDAELQAIPVAFLTADDSADRREDLLSLGAWHLFNKPFLPKTFAAELVRLFRES
jgi:CheY-like chemotaxis protein